jgi:hypothetical protein
LEDTVKQPKEIMKKQTIILFLITILATGTTLVAQELREMPRGWANYEEADWVEHCENLIAELNIEDERRAQKNWFGETPSDRTQINWFGETPSYRTQRAEQDIEAARRAQKNWFGETRTQKDFSYALNDATACVKRLNDDYKNGDYKLSKKWKYFGEYKLGKP